MILILDKAYMRLSILVLNRHVSVLKDGVSLLADKGLVVHLLIELQDTLLADSLAIDHLSHLLLNEGVKLFGYSI